MSHLYQISDQIIHDVIEGEVIALNLQSGTYFNLQKLAVWVWHVLSRPVSIEQIIHAITAGYSIDRAIVSMDVHSFVAKLQEQGLVEAIESQDGIAEPLTPLTVEGEPYAAPQVEMFTDVQELLTIDPIHDVDEMGWPHPKPTL